MATDVKASKRINHERLVRFVQAAFEKLGVANAERKSPQMRSWQPICAASTPTA